MVTDLMSKLEAGAEKGEGGLEVEGRPGTGKSTTIWAWALLYAAAKSAKKMLWAHLIGGTAACSVVSIADGTMTSNVFGDLKKLDAAMQHKYDVIVLDGMVEQNRGDVTSFWIPHARKDTLMVLTTSQTLKSNAEDRKILGMITSTYFPWTLGEYQTAVKDDDFYSSLDGVLGGAKNADLATRAELVEKKEYIAGMSGRWMFAMTADEVEKEIEMYVANSGGFDRVIEWSGCVGGDERQIAVNQLIMPYKKWTYFS